MAPREERADELTLEFACARGWLARAQLSSATTPAARGALLRELASGLPEPARAELQQAWASACAGLASADPQAALADADVQGTLPGGDFQATRQGLAAPCADAQATLPLGPSAPAYSPTASGAASALAGEERLGPYRLIRELARGGMGAVYVARRDELDREVALKVLLAGPEASQDQVERFSAEARLSARLRHPNIVSVLDVGVAEQRHYLAMDLIRGESLKARLARGPLPPREAAELGQVLASALAFAHRQAVLHRDLKPHNVLLEEGGRPLLTDFGLAKDTGQAEGLTKTGEVMGTPAYMAPEQAAGEGDLIDRRSDVYGLGATLYEALSGAPPFSGDTVFNVINAVLTKAPPPLRRLRPEVPHDLETIVMTCLEKEPLARYASAQALADDLARYLADEPIQARASGPLEQAARWVRRHRRVASSVALALTLALIGGAGSLIWSSRAEVLAAQSEHGRLAGLAASELRRLEGIAAATSGAEALILRRGAFTSAQRWQALAPGDAAPYLALREALTQLQTQACALEEWRSARSAGEQLLLLARSAEVPPERGAELVAFVSEREAQLEAARQARFLSRQGELEAHILAARPRRPLARPTSLTAELVWLVQQRRPEAEAALIALGQQLLAACVRAQAEHFAQTPPRARRLVERWLGAPAPASSEQLTTADAVALARASALMSGALPLDERLQAKLDEAFPDLDPVGCLELVCLGLAHVSGRRPAGTELLGRLALATSGTRQVEFPLRGILVASAEANMVPFQFAVLLSGGTRRIPIDILQGFVSAYRVEVDFGTLTLDAQGEQINRASAHILARRFGQALDALEGLSSVNARLARGEILNGLGLPEEAILELSSPDLADSSLAFALQARAWLSLGCPRLAIRAARRAIALRAENVRAWQCKAQAELRLEAYGEAQSSYERLQQLTAPSPELGALGLEILRRRGAGGPANALARDALARDPKDPQLLIEAARLFLDQGDLTQAEAAIGAASRAAARPSDLFQARAVLRLLQGHPDQAREDLRLALMRDPFHKEAFERQVILEEAHLFPLELFARRFPASRWGRRRLGARLLREHELQAALNHLTALLWLEPSASEVRYQRIEAALGLDAVDLALSDLERLREAGSRTLLWQRHWVSALLKAKRSDEALAAAQAARERWPEDPTLRLTEGVALGKLGRREEAARALGAVIASDAPIEIRRAAERVQEQLGQLGR